MTTKGMKIPSAPTYLAMRLFQIASRIPGVEPLPRTPP